MIQHFSYRSLFPDRRLPGWKFSFYYNRTRMEGVYHADGRIEWTGAAPGKTDEANLQKQIHDLMIYHVYDQER